MDEKKFYEIVEGGTGCAVVLAGSDSDGPHIDKLADAFKKWGIPYDVRVCSAHKQPERLLNILAMYNVMGGSLVNVAVAGGSDALSGMVSWYSRHPVISCPPDLTPTNPVNMSCLTSPPGSSNLYAANPANVARAIAQIYSGVNEGFRDRLIDMNVAKVRKLEGFDGEFRAKYFKRQWGE